MKKCVFTFDDGLETHLKLAAPCLKDNGFGATFFVTGARKLWHRMEPAVREDELEWDRVADIHQMGFEIGNHTWSHNVAGRIRDVEKLEQFLMVEYNIITRSFCYPAYEHTDELVLGLKKGRYKHARKGYSTSHAMASQDRTVTDYYTQYETDPFLIYATGLFGKEADYNFDQFREDLANTPERAVPIFAFHGLRGLGREKYFDKCVRYLKDEGWQIVAMEDLDD
jgi:peptidoglycan/xylan/chitin deacetylase (PgdA/CDA1 family)